MQQDRERERERESVEVWSKPSIEIEDVERASEAAESVKIKVYLPSDVVFMSPELHEFVVADCFRIFVHLLK